MIGIFLLNFIHTYLGILTRFPDTGIAVLNQFAPLVPTHKMVLFDDQNGLWHLTYIYSEYDGDNEKAFKLAMQAKEAAPEDPHVLDTLGWILYQKGDYKWALSTLTDSVNKLPDNAEIRFHLGMTQYKLNDTEAAKQNLSKALELDDKFRGAEQTKQALEKIK